MRSASNGGFVLLEGASNEGPGTRGEARGMEGGVWSFRGWVRSIARPARSTGRRPWRGASGVLVGSLRRGRSQRSAVSDQRSAFSLATVRKGHKQLVKERRRSKTLPALRIGGLERGARGEQIRRFRSAGHARNPRRRCQAQRPLRPQRSQRNQEKKPQINADARRYCACRRMRIFVSCEDSDD